MSTMSDTALNMIDLEANGDARALLKLFEWRDVNVTVKDTKTKQPFKILDGITGGARPGEMVALMGPSGSGKTTLLNVLARRPAAASASVEGELLIDGNEIGSDTLRSISTYVEQEDALIGSLTVRETIEFAARLAPTGAGRKERVTALIKAFGLEMQQDAMIGTPVKKGISGGQKRRVSVASQLITRPKILFLDEPTSGLDSTASFEVMSRIKKVAEAENMIVIVSIHQPSTATFALFSQLVLLSRGRVVYSGKTDEAVPYFAGQGFPVPNLTNPAEYYLDVCNVDFDAEAGDVDRLNRLIDAWNDTNKPKEFRKGTNDMLAQSGVSHRSSFHKTFVLLHRQWIKSYRDILAYWIRVAMYLGLALMMGTVWLRLDSEQRNIQVFTNAIFFSGAFMSFMAVAYIPAFIEDYSSFVKERNNGLYGPTSFLLSNFLIGIPFIFLNTLLFSIITVFLVNFRTDATSFFKYVMWLFLDLLAAESLVVLVSSVIPVFVIALAVTAFINGLWMSVGGFLVPQNVLNDFWYYTFYWINYQRYVFQAMMFNEFDGREYQCDRAESGEGWQCMYASPLQGEGKIAGQSVLKAMGYGKREEGMWIGILLAIIVGLRLLAWIALKIRKH
ncbi:P-loop containing nucleoside triphosphate hydrolase protein [Tricharina praecox]|uniref:P-loop containing nucleoside triphosphate hydrolase protein n=1 Tax=Tricharina praecox TaxID=43433 RepID=UPI0022205268|nr:P-loop containing nucleoside triphosphate hydrolase protein [Tricharina praecox]KAI5859039.1 P-loop containing nucleoside triphosphate hydrolase protein [Tricharina praecox]